MSSSYLSLFDSKRACFQVSQDQSIRNLVDLRMHINRMRLRDHLSDEELNPSKIEKLLTRFGLASAKIENRSTEIIDYILKLPAEAEACVLFKSAELPSLDIRMELYQKYVGNIFKEFYPDPLSVPKHLIHVTCTGYLAPSPAQARMAELKARTQVTHAYHMGCYASLPALRIAEGFDENTDVVHTELCSLHFDPLSLVPEQIVVQSLFADGHIRYQVGPEKPRIHGFEIKALLESLIPESVSMMTWTPGKSGFHMTLDRKVPELLKANLNGFVNEILDLAKVKRSDSLIFAIHPGGPKIIEAVEEALNLSRPQSTESHDVLRKHGNMSSATLPHVWKAILENPERKDGQIVVSLAFGPGLTLSGGVFRLCRS